MKWRKKLHRERIQSISQTLRSSSYFSIRTRTHSKTRNDDITFSTIHLLFIFSTTATAGIFTTTIQSTDLENTLIRTTWIESNWMLEHFSCFRSAINHNFDICSRMLRTCDVVYTEAQVALVRTGKSCMHFYIGFICICWQKQLPLTLSATVKCASFRSSTFRKSDRWRWRWCSGMCSFCVGVFVSARFLTATHTYRLAAVDSWIHVLMCGRVCSVYFSTVYSIRLWETKHNFWTIKIDSFIYQKYIVSH